MASGVFIAAENTVYAVAEVEPPAHLDKIVPLLILIAGLLSELSEYQSLLDKGAYDEHGESAES